MSILEIIVAIGYIGLAIFCIFGMISTLKNRNVGGFLGCLMISIFCFIVVMLSMHIVNLAEVADFLTKPIINIK